MLQVPIHHISLLKKFVVLKTKVRKIDINQLVNVWTSINYLKTKVDELDVDKLQTVPVRLKKLSDVVDNKVAKSKKLTH